MPLPIIAAPALVAGAKAVAGSVTFLTAIRQASKYLMAANAGSSLVGYTQIGRVEPMALIDESVRNSPMLADTMQVLQSQFTGYLLRAFTLHNISIGSVSVAQRLEPFSTHRSAASALAINMRHQGQRLGVGNEAYEDRLPVEGDVRALPEDVLEIALESQATARQSRGPAYYRLSPEDRAAEDARIAHDEALDKAEKQAQADKEAHRRDVVAASTSGNDITVGASKVVDMSEAASLAVGKMVNVTITQDGNSVTVPLAVKLNCFFMAQAPLLHIMAVGSQDISFSARWKKWWHGGIDFWNDLVWCQDLIDAHKKNLKADKTGVYLQMMQRRASNSKAAIVSQMPSANSASNIIVLSAEAAAALEMRVNGKLKDFKVRQRIFQEGYGMLLAVIDDKWGRVRIYTRDIPEFTEVAERDLKASAKGNGPDIGDILSAFRAGSSPRL